MIKLLFLFSTLFISSAFASERYDSDTVNDIQEIYWLNTKQDGAILYARHAGFVQLKNVIDNIILTSQQIENHQFKIENAEKLLLMLPASKESLVVYMRDNQLFYGGHTYIADKETIKELLRINKYRIEKGDEISHQLLKKALLKYKNIT
jgi:hypothetical protein